MKNKIILGIDPGPEKSAYVFLCGQSILKAGYVENSLMLYMIQDSNYDMCAVEGVCSFGKKDIVGPGKLACCELAGIFYQAARSRGKVADILYSSKPGRNGSRAIRQFFGNKKRDEINEYIDKYILPGCYGYKKNRGPLYMKTTEAKKQDHKMCAATVAIVFQGSAQYQKECMK